MKRNLNLIANGISFIFTITAILLISTTTCGTAVACGIKSDQINRTINILNEIKTNIERQQASIHPITAIEDPNALKPEWENLAKSEMTISEEITELEELMDSAQEQAEFAKLKALLTEYDRETTEPHHTAERSTKTEEISKKINEISEIKKAEYRTTIVPILRECLLYCLISIFLVASATTLHISVNSQLEV